jgi:hypothetical protein
MKRTQVRSIVLAALLLAAVPFARAQGAELTAMAGYHFGGEFNNIETTGVDSIEVEDSDGWGIILGFPTSKDTKIEVLYSRQSTKLRGHGEAFSSGGSAVADVEVDILHIGGTYEIPEGKGQFSSFAGFSMGGTRYNPGPGLDDLTRFSLSLYGGEKVVLGKHAGLRLQLRWTPTFISSSTTMFCSSTGKCFVVGSGEVVSDIEVAAGLTLRF